MQVLIYLFVKGRMEKRAEKQNKIIEERVGHLTLILNNLRFCAF
jgi:hypothetical protein